ncbi:NADH:flavin oxidoreductase [Frankia sp. CNm7]|uniref:NADH:flavin oxidoreductase n=1 Tax=Frankia nepalensis TaxID=1836974 RepID=A0A937RIR5_9ACTN|nr:NADH:flavin oxidoreductase [Frankia nepalensis]MBL7502649.1 NADH:flavin oxidoreductase [Frankia nepalensis]MBL7514875.1 NADH:flavin oxidoreductase [Frankia nepalensis]MBL7524626.1 NADH:flavin oxidoreductase [Frankia nepalensis]MBL7633021.1 NADH:flavin oxidoreductase [Frankia nepalensis]
MTVSSNVAESSPAAGAASPLSSARLLDGTDATPLFTGFSLSGVELANRFVMAPMTRQFSPNGVPGADVAGYYARRAAHVGLVVTEGTYVDHPAAGSSDRVPRFHGEDALAGWRRVVDAVHAVGGRIVPQLWHLGAHRVAGAPPRPEAAVFSPSGLRADGTVIGDEPSTKEIDAVVASFARAAADARRVGFDGVELHGAHGYLLDQFFWPRTNRRADGYGGSPANRARLAAEVVAAVRDAVGPDFPVVYRFSQWKGGHYDARIAETPDQLEALLTPLVDAGATALHVSTRRYWLPAFEGSPRTLAGWAKNLTGLPTIAIGSIGVPTAFLGDNESAAATLSLAPLMELFDRGEFDLVALGRALLSEPAWPTKLRDRDLSGIRAYDKADGTRLT